MRAARIDCPSVEAPYAEAEAAFVQAKAYLSSRDAQQMSESDLERELHRRGQELMRTLRAVSTTLRQPDSAFSVAPRRCRRARSTVREGWVVPGGSPHAGGRPG